MRLVREGTHPPTRTLHGGESPGGKAMPQANSGSRPEGGAARAIVDGTPASVFLPEELLPRFKLP